MKTAPLLLAATLLAPPALAAPMKCKVDEPHSRIQFTAFTALFDATGHFNDYDVVGKLDPEAFEKSDLKLVIKTKSIDTDNGTRDNHLRSDDFFHTDKYPKATFTITEIKKGKKPGWYVMQGDLKIKDTTTKQSIPVEVKTADFNKKGKRVTTVTGDFSLDRFKVGVDWPGSLLLPDIDKKVDMDVVITCVH